MLWFQIQKLHTTIHRETLHVCGQIWPFFLGNFCFLILGQICPFFLEFSSVYFSSFFTFQLGSYKSSRQAPRSLLFSTLFFSFPPHWNLRKWFVLCCGLMRFELRRSSRGAPRSLFFYPLVFPIPPPLNSLEMILFYCNLMEFEFPIWFKSNRSSRGAPYYFPFFFPSLFFNPPMNSLEVALFFCILMK